MVVTQMCAWLLWRFEWRWPQLVFGTKVSVWSHDLIDHNAREHTLAVCIGMFVVFSSGVVFSLPMCCAWLWDVFSSLEMVSYAYAHVLYGSLIVWCGDFFCYSLNLCEMHCTLRWWKFLDIALLVGVHVWCPSHFGSERNLVGVLVIKSG